MDERESSDVSKGAPASSGGTVQTEEEVTGRSLSAEPRRQASRMTVAQLLRWAIEITNAAAVVAVWTRDKDLFERAGAVAHLTTDWKGDLASEPNEQQRKEFAESVDALSDHLEEVRTRLSTTRH